MSMSKKDFIALADAITRADQEIESCTINANMITRIFVEHIARDLEDRYPRFKAQRWRDYIAGLCGPNGGKV